VVREPYTYRTVQVRGASACNNLITSGEVIHFNSEDNSFFLQRQCFSDDLFGKLLSQKVEIVEYKIPCILKELRSVEFLRTGIHSQRWTARLDCCELMHSFLNVLWNGSQIYYKRIGQLRKNNVCELEGRVICYNLPAHQVDT